jgi:energy-coupling factor transport system ATP-binding protein
MGTPIIRVENLSFTYLPENGTPVPALHGVSLSIEPGEYVAILGHNGSGKSTLARHLNALLLPTAGRVWVKDWNTQDATHVLDIRSTVGMVFQNPDNQMLATIVEEDVAFGPENLAVPHDELMARVTWALEQVDMTAYRQRAPHLLSGGQKQRVCIAGVLAMQPEVLALDEATAMLDPLGRREVLDTVMRLNREQGVTVIAITHHMEEAVEASRVVVMADGHIELDGTPREIFSQVERLQALQMDVPQVTQLAGLLHHVWPGFPSNLLSSAELTAAVRDQLAPLPAPAAPPPVTAAPDTRERIIDVRGLGHDYLQGTPLSVTAICDVNLNVYRGEIVGVIGHTGCGKSTAIQHLNGLYRPQRGQVRVLGQDLRDPKLNVRQLRSRVGLLFQNAEAQLFEQYVGDDVAYGPRNLKLSREDVRARVRRAMDSVGLGFEEFKDRITFGLSGGQMRRVALAGVLALEPEVLVLDEPTAGLDPQGRRQLYDTLLALHAGGLTLVIVSHNMEELAQVCHRLFVIDHGKTVLSGTPAEVFAQAAELRRMGLGVPGVTTAVDDLRQAGLLAPGPAALTVEQAAGVLQGAFTELPAPVGAGPYTV